MKEYKEDPLLRNYSIVIIDEAHERKVDTDIAFGIMKQILKKRSDLKVREYSLRAPPGSKIYFFSRASNLNEIFTEYVSNLA